MKAKRFPLFSQDYRLSLLVLSIALISYQLAIINLISIIQWHHFGYMIISVALLGFGASGTALTLFRNALHRKVHSLFPILLIFSGISMILSLRLSQNNYLAFDSLLVFSEISHILRLIINYLFFFLPFFFAGLAIGLLFSTNASNISTLYFFNLLGSGMGGLLLLLISPRVMPQQAVTISASLPILAGLLTMPKKSRGLFFTIAPLLLSLLVLDLLFPQTLFLSQYKSISKTLELPDSKIIAEKNTPFGLIQGVESQYIRYGTGFTLSQPVKVPMEKVVFTNGNWTGGVIGKEHSSVFDYSTIGFPYNMRSFCRILALDSGTGETINYALYKGGGEVIAVTGNPALSNFITSIVSNPTENPYLQPSVTVSNSDSYNYLLSTNDNYDLITLPVLDIFGGSSGISALQEKQILTTESWQRMWDLLSDNGMITVSAWLDNPLRFPLRIISSFSELLTNNGISQPVNHVAAVRNWSLITYVLSKRPITPSEIEAVRDFAAKNRFDILHLPGINEDERIKFNILANQDLLTYSDAILEGISENFYDDYPFKIHPVTIDRPYFFQFFKIMSFGELAKTYSLSDLPYMEVGYLILYLTFFKVILLSTLFIITPLIRKKWANTNRLWTLFHFLGIGLGFMLAEIVLIQKLIPYLSTPLYSTAIVISAMLVFSGFGSLFSAGINYTPRRVGLNLQTKNCKPPLHLPFKWWIVFIVGLILTMLVSIGLLIPFVISQTISLPLIWKCIITVTLLAPLSFFMGFLFPLGISYLNNTSSKENICWAWAINGSMSVIGSVLAMIIAVELGFFSVLLSAMICYVLVMIANLYLTKSL